MSKKQLKLNNNPVDGSRTAAQCLQVRKIRTGNLSKTYDKN